MRQYLPLREVMLKWRPGSFDHTWEEEILDLFCRDTIHMAELIIDIRKNGMRDPVLLGNDGRMWDGHHRTAVYYLLGQDLIAIEYGEDESKVLR